jgi:hypothetical protein
MLSREPGTSDAACSRCSKSIRPGTGNTGPDGERLHPRCLARPTVEAAIETGATAQESQRPAKRLADCPICSRPLSTLSPVVHKGEQLYGPVPR